MNLMIDLETLGISPKAPIISIGACFFDKEGIYETFYVTLDTGEQMDSGKRVADSSTIKWWMSQEDAAKKVFKEDAIDTETALQTFVEFCLNHHDKKNTKPWGNGATFDISMLESIMSDYGISEPWMFYNIRDLRTFKEYIYDGKDTERKGTYHNALDDAIHQAQVVIDGLNNKIINTKLEE